MEVCHIGFRSGYQGCQACDKAQRLEDDMGGTVVPRCLQPLAVMPAGVNDKRFSGTAVHLM